MKTTKLFLTFALIAVFQFAHAQFAVHVNGQLTNTSGTPINVTLSLNPGSGGPTLLATVATDVNGNYSYTFATSQDSGSVDMQLTNCNSNVVTQSEFYDLYVGDSLVSFTTIDYCPPAPAAASVYIIGQLTNTTGTPLNIDVYLYDGFSVIGWPVTTDASGNYSHTFPSTVASSGVVEIIGFDCNNDSIYESKQYDVPVGDTLVNFTTVDYCPLTLGNVYASGNLINTNSAAINVTLVLFDGSSTINATAVTDASGNYSHTFATTATSQGTVSMLVQDCNSDSIFETQSYDLNINDSLANFTTADYCPSVTPPAANVYASGSLTNTSSAAINVSLVLFDGNTSTTATAVTDANGNYSHTFTATSTSQGTVYMQVQDCNSDSIFETKAYDVTIGDTIVNFTTFDYCPVTTCQAYFTIAQATGATGGPIAGSVQVTDSSTASNPANLTYTWYFGDGSPNGTGTVLTHNYSINGPYALCLTINDGLGCISSYCDTISVDSSGMLESEGFILYIGSEPLAVEETNFSSAVNVYPNPASDFINIEFNTGHKALHRITMYDLTGKVVYEDNNANTSNNKTAINTENIAPGTYLIQMLFNNELHSEKVIIK